MRDVVDAVLRLDRAIWMWLYKESRIVFGVEFGGTFGRADDDAEEGFMEFGRGRVHGFFEESGECGGTADDVHMTEEEGCFEGCVGPYESPINRGQVSSIFGNELWTSYPT